MFKKKPNIKTLSPLRSSDRRKIADQIISDFHIEVPEHNTDQQSHGNEMPSGGLSATRSSLLPDNALSGRFTTTVGPDLRPVNGTVYVGVHAEEEQRILWVKIEERMYPTVYTLWHNPLLVPLLHTPSIVMGKLRGGADLMVPGLARGPPFPALANKGSIVAVARVENPTVPLFVGLCEIDISRLETVQGQKGKAVRGVHWLGDELWEWGTTSVPRIVPEAIDGWDVGNSVDALALEHGSENLANESKDDQDQGGVPLSDVEKLSLNEDDDFEHKRTDLTGQSNAADDISFTTKEIDEVFRQAFLYGVYQHKTNHPDDPRHGLKYPLTSSYVISELVLPFLPTFTESEATSFQLKKTSWKNTKKFIKFLDKERLVKSKDRNGGETVILDIDFEDRAVIGFVPYKLPRKNSNSTNGGNEPHTQSPSHSKDPSIGQHLKRLAFYRPKEKLAPIFQAASASVKSTYLASEIRPIVAAYIDSESLIVPTNKRMIKLNPVLANAVFDPAFPKDREVLAKGEATREVLMERVIQICSPFWAILQDEQLTNDIKPKAGSPPNVQILLETRSGNKTVSKISGLEAYHINPQPLAEELQKACASSTSVNQLVGSSPKTPLIEVMVQGPQSQAIIKALEGRGVNRQWIDINDKTKRKKR